MLRTRIRLFIYFAGSALLPLWLPMIFSENGLSTFKLMKLIKHWFIFRWEAVRGGHQGGRGPGGCRGCHPPTPRPTQARLPLPGPLPPALCTVRTTRATREREREREDDINVVVIEIVRAVNSDPHRSGRGNFFNKNRKRARKFVIIVIYWNFEVHFDQLHGVFLLVGNLSGGF